MAFFVFVMVLNKHRGIQGKVQWLNANVFLTSTSFLDQTFPQVLPAALLRHNLFLSFKWMGYHYQYQAGHLKLAQG